MKNVLGAVLPNTKIVALADRDDKSEREVNDWEKAGNLVLPERNLESLLLADEVLQALVIQACKPELLDDALQIKENAVAASVARGNARDDLKSAAGEIYNGVKDLLDLQRQGNNTTAFLRDTMAPLIVPGMQTYQELQTAIVDKL